MTESSKPLVAIAGMRAQAYGILLDGAELLRDYDPAWFDAHVAQLPITTGTGLGVMAAFWQMVERDVCPLRWPWDATGQTLDEACGATPEDTLRSFGDASEEFLIGEARYYLMEPRPVYYGIGAQSIVCGDEDLPCSGLGALLWHLFEHTSLSLGLQEVLDESPGYRGDLKEIIALRRLPANTPVDLLLCRLAGVRIPDIEMTVGADQVIRYAFGATDSELANYSEFEVREMMFDHEWSWDRLDLLRAEYLRADEIGTAFWAWDHALDASENRPRALRRVAAWLHAHARAVQRDLNAGPKTLVEMVAREEARAA